MEIYIIKNYCWYNEDTDQIQDDHRIPHLELTKTRKEVKKIAEKYGVKIMKWEKRERKGWNEKILETLYTIKVGEKIHITKDKSYAKKLAIQAFLDFLVNVFPADYFQDLRPGFAVYVNDAFFSPFTSRWRRFPLRQIQPAVKPWRV
jgi:hypothetical protein